MSDRKKDATLFATFKAVAWSFLGIRKGADYEKDAENLNPFHVVIVGIIAAAIFVLLLIMIVQHVVNNPV